MGSCVSKYEIPQDARYFTGEVGESVTIPAEKYKSVSSKKYAGTNTFEDIIHENAPIGGDIYYHFNSSKAYKPRTSPSLPPTDEVRVEYGLNPYATKEDVYQRSRTDNLAYNRQNNSPAQQNQLSNRPQGDFSRKPSAQEQNGRNPENQIDYSRLFRESGRDSREPEIKMTESKFL